MVSLKYETRKLCILVNNLIKLHTSRLFLLQLIPGFAVFVQCRGSNAVNNEHFMKMFVFDLFAFRSQVKTMYFDVRNQLVISDSM